MSLRVAAFIDSLGPGGAERVMATLTGSWSKQGHTVSVVTFADPSSDFYPVDPRTQRVGIGLLGPAGSAVAAAALNVRRAIRIRGLLAAARPDVAVSFIDRMNVVVLAASRRLGVPVVVSERIDPRFYHPDLAVRGLRRALYPRADAIVVQTRAVADSWAIPRFGGDTVHVIPNPIEVGSAPATLTTRGRTFVGMGRLVPQKGFDLLVSAFARVAQDLPDWSLKIYGEGPERQRLLDQARQSGYGDRIFLPGIASDAMAVLDAAGVFVLSSRFEGFPNVLLEALASGAPAVSFTCPSGPDEIIQSGVSGLLVPPDDQHGLAEAMRKAATDNGLRARLAQGGREAASRFRTEVVVAAWNEVLDAVTRSRDH